MSLNQLRSYYDFRGGLNVDTALDNLMDNELTLAENVDLMERGGLQKRKGTKRINENSYEKPVEQLIEWGKNDGSLMLLAIIGTKLCKVSDAGVSTEIADVATDKIGYMFHQDKVFFVDGNKYRVYDGSTVQDVVAYDDEKNDLSPIKKCTMIVRHPKSMRFFCAGNTTDKAALYFSEPGAPDFFKETSKMYPTTGDGPITGLTIFGDAVMVFFKHSIWIWRGMDPEIDAIWEKIPTGVGTVSNSSVVLTTNSLTFLGDGGLYSISPAILSYTLTLQPGQDLVANLTNSKVNSIINGINKPEVSFGIFDAINQKYMLAYTDEHGERNNRILVMDWGTMAFTEYTNIQANCFLLRRNGDLLVGSNGYILQMNVGGSDADGSPIPMKIRTKQYNLDFPFHKKRILRLYMSFKQPEQETSIITMRLYVDDTMENEIVKADVYDNFIWGDDWGGIWGFRNQVTTRSKVSASGHRVQMEFENLQEDVPTVIYGCAFEFRPVRAKGSRL